MRKFKTYEEPNEPSGIGYCKVYVPIPQKRVKKCTCQYNLAKRFIDKCGLIHNSNCYVR